jgi:hypothetical protein
MSRNLSKLHINTDIIADWRLIEGPVRGSLLIVNDPLIIPDSVMNALNIFAEQGGKILFTSGALNCGAKGIQELTGLVSLSGETYKIRAAIPDSRKTSMQYNNSYKILPANADVVLMSDNGMPFLTRNKKGRGLVWYCAAPIFEETGSTDNPDIIRSLMDIILPENERKISVKAPEWIEVVLRKQENPVSRTIVHLVNMTDPNTDDDSMKTNIPLGSPIVLSVRVTEKPAFITLEPGGREPSHWEYKDGIAVIKIEDIDIHEIVELTFSE